LELHNPADGTAQANYVAPSDSDTRSDGQIRTHRETLLTHFLVLGKPRGIAGRGTQQFKAGASIRSDMRDEQTRDFILSSRKGRYAMNDFISEYMSNIDTTATSPEETRYCKIVKPLRAGVSGLSGA